MNLKGIRTLIVDDELSVRTALNKPLTDWGAEIVEVESGPRAIAELTRARDARQPFGLIFLDSTMSPLDGFAVADQLKAHAQELARTVLMVGPERIAQEVPRARKLGLGYYVTKPLTRSAIIGAIATVLNLDVEHADGHAPAAKRKQRFRILLAEDTADVSWIIRTLIEGPDYQVDVAQDGAVAADLFRMVDYDLVLMDLQMPNFDGYWATREIRNWERQNHLKHTPIIAVTAFAHEEDPSKSFRAGLDGYLAKPITREVLLKVMSKHLGLPAKTG